MGLRNGGWIHLVVQPPMQPNDRVVLDQHVVEGRGGYIATSEPDDEYAAFKGNALGGACVSITTDRIEDNVGAPAAGHVLYYLDEILFTAIDDDICPEILSHLCLLGA